MLEFHLAMSTVAILIVAFQTNAFYEWIALVTRKFGTEALKSWLEQEFLFFSYRPDLDGNYILFIREKFSSSNFILKLLTCEACSAMWMTAALGMAFGVSSLTLAIYAEVLFVYYLFVAIILLVRYLTKLNKGI